jgi:rhodanese-related sulfurtransferase
MDLKFTAEDIRANREYFAAKLRAEEQKANVVRWVKNEPGGHEIVLLDTRSRDAFAKAHIQGAVNIPIDELRDLAAQLPRDKVLVAYCWNHY